MKNKVQLITYANRLGNKGLTGIYNLLENEFEGVFGGVHLLPFYYPIDGSDAGYDPIDHTEVDKRIGSWDTVKKLALKYEVMGDIIVNHISAESKEFLDVMEKGRESEYYELFLTEQNVFPDGASEEALGKIYRPRPGLPFTEKTLNNGEKMTLWTTFTENQLDIAINHPLGIKYLNSILERFRDSGVKSIRLDAAGYAIKKPNTSCFMLPETYEFISDFTQKAHRLGMNVLVEIHSHFQQQIKIAEKADFVYDFALPPLVLHSIRTGRFSELKKWLEISPRNCVTVLDTHDGIGVIDVGGHDDLPGLLTDEDINALVESIHKNSLGNSRKATGESASNLDLYQVNCTFYDALGKNDRNYLIARAIQFFCPGVPQVYYVGLLAGENDMDLLENNKVGRDINRHYYDLGEIREALQKDVVKALIQLIKFRNSHPSFSGDFSIEKTTKHELHLAWLHENHRADLKVNLKDNIFLIEHSDGIETKKMCFGEK